MLLLVVCLGNVQGISAHDSMWRLSTHMSLCVTTMCPLHISVCVCLSTWAPPLACVSECCVHRCVCLYPCPRRQCVCYPHAWCLHDPESELQRDWEQERAHEDASQRICQWFLINPRGTQQMPVLINHGKLCWFWGVSFSEHNSGARC